jgi:biopolymer transport protein ExbB/TolQ
MSTLSMSSVSLLVGATALGAGVSWLVTALRYRSRLLTLAGQFDQAERARVKAQELAVQARQQVETLQQALSEAKRDGAIQSASASARAAAAAAAIEEAKAAKVKARAELMRQLDTADAPDRSSHGFADTQPFGR